MSDCTLNRWNGSGSTAITAITLAAALIVIAMALGCSSNNKQAETPVQAAPAVPKPVSDVVAVLNNKEQKIGQEITFRDVAVQDADGQDSKKVRQIWVGPSETEQILVVYPPDAVPLAKGKEQKLSRGSVVTVAGTVKKAPEAAQAAREWHLKKDQAEQIAQAGVYVEASRILPQGG